MLDVNLKGCFTYATRRPRVIKDQRSGRIVNIASINGLRGKFGQANYAASKGGMVALGQDARARAGKFGVTVNVVAPGMVLTDMTRSLPPEVVEHAMDETVLGPPGRAGGLRGRGGVPVLRRGATRHRRGVPVDGGQYI